MARDPLDALSCDEARAVLAALRNEFVVDALSQWRFERARLDGVRAVAFEREKDAEAAASAADAAMAAQAHAPHASDMARHRARWRAQIARQRLNKASAATQAAFDALYRHDDAEREAT